MGRLYRPHTPISVCVTVAERQFAEKFGFDPDRATSGCRSATAWLAALLHHLFGHQKVHLHHRPALVNRVKLRTYLGRTAYIPGANDPDHLAFLLAGKGEEHDVETRVRGLRGQHSDLGLARKRKRKERKERRRLRPRGRLRGRGFDKSKTRGFDGKVRPRV